MPADCLLTTDLPHWPVRRGKVRDVYDLGDGDLGNGDLGDRVLLIATDRLSAYDWVLPTGIPDKGRVLTQTSVFWFDRVGIPHHLITADVDQMQLPDDIDRSRLAGRTMLCRKSQVVPFECVVRGYLSGSGWKEYQQSGTVCGVQLPPGLQESDKLPEPIFTPATKADEGHDENVPFERMVADLGTELAEELRRKSLEIYTLGAEYAAERGILIADTKFEFGQQGGQVILIDEVMTPDSSRFWPADQYEPGRGQKSFDKQYVRDWLSSTTWDKNSEPPELPAEVVAGTRAKYIEAYEQLTGEEFE
ncbi:Phosphoribosylaminoimidazole-succinocarboxamide synthase [Posidoniimonas polymericola]|uniref:Phosphoribosylaminoimidazole-succinocarboxamide synthase n=1 Tax=Posidoniimonas polymericola TaxID=2528002 RepID=A0A5C5ZEP3_9BACT|nr:phosphoribosylaminoimidazolesuccinocarboxamide synthase [Posidoniimonas polymericola]TWT85625.1 Phosphoribosylaminoimidazole-succinocarboxamide synthase [Posidoniimonas polymericola]